MADHETSRLLAHEDPRDSFDADELRLLRQEEGKQIRRERKRMVLCLSLAIILTSSAVAFTFFFAKKSLGRSRNVIMMVSDGFGPASETYARSYYAFTHNLTEAYITPLDEILVGASRTRSSDSLVTDSAAGATAFSCAMKSYNAAIGVDANGTPCGTVLEAAKDLGMLTGLVVTSRVTHATPAAFSAHVVHRDLEADIAVQQIGDYALERQVDLIMGGGRCFFLPNTTDGGCRTDGRNLIEESKRFGWNTVMLNRKDFDAHNMVNEDQEGEEEEEEDRRLVLPALGLFHSDHMNFEIDRDATQEPSLVEMTKAALKALTDNAGANQGFFLLIEGSRIDMAAHNNDPAAHVREILEYHETVKEVRKFVAEHPDTLLISTSDHETGGFTLGVQNDPNTYPDYLWRPEVIQRARVSTEILTRRLTQFHSQSLQKDTKKSREFVKTEILKKGLGITDATEAEIALLANPDTSPLEVLPFLGHAISRRANLGWTTQGHTGVDVNLYADGDNDGRKDLYGNHENTDIGVAMSKYLNVDLDYITRKDASKWFKPKSGFQSAWFGRSQHEESGN
ncbi:hypothetical protein BGZ99_010157 [Dissophora globulifera]|uniref:Alkaline phosphatase n=1 Tax=Dissophora globulifera TaxID=979702 RepID=A0A9P6R6S9_9FUNG|nr:hypothetical protein BGZ99_010157 [Dissophora globulifera]